VGYRGGGVGYREGALGYGREGVKVKVSSHARPGTVITLHLRSRGLIRPGLQSCPEELPQLRCLNSVH
jgi:hypothetical protein